ncbi:SCL-interrupting locus protein homolog isoform X2 [Nelusetta ayraudi]|uniref:SCL-interrupting locus protein homolog isoform X2 n=1 Tax=Nelusetta ayraudi TaxID=303726 RepID=UPI003F722338
MSCPVNLQQLPAEVLLTVCPGGRNSRNYVTPLSFPKSRRALWEDNASGEKLRLQLLPHRKPQVLLQVKTLRLAQRLAHRSTNPRPLAFFLGSLSVDADEEGVTVTLDRFDPGRDQPGPGGQNQDQPGSWARVPSAVVPGDVVVPCLFSRQSQQNIIQSEAEFHHCFTCLQQVFGGRQTLDVSQVLKVRGQVTCSQQSDSASFALSLCVIGPVLPLEVQRLRPLPLIPTALLRSLTGVERSLLQSPAPRRGFLTMDQSRKLLLLLESDPKACSLPLVGVWLSGVAHVYNPQVWFWSVRYLLSPALLDRVFSERSFFLLLLFGSTHSAPQFFQCRRPGSGAGPGPQLDYQLLTASQWVTLYQVAPVEGRSLCCRLEEGGGQVEMFLRARSSFSSAALPAGQASTDQDSGVEEEEELSPRPSPSPHQHHLQLRQVQPSVPELSLLLDASFLSGRAGPAHHQQLSPPPGCPRPPPPPPPDPAPQQHLALPPSWPRPPPAADWSSTCRSPPHHSTPNCGSSPRHPTSFYSLNPSPLQDRPPPSQPQSLPPSAPLVTSPPPPLPPPIWPLPPGGPVGGVMAAEAHVLLVQQEQQLRLLQAQVQMLLEAQRPKSSASVAVETGASLLWEPRPQHEETLPTSPYRRPAADMTGQEVEGSPSGGSSCPIPAEGDGHDLQGFYQDLMDQLTSRLQEEEEPGGGRSLCGDAPSCQPSRGPLGCATQRQEVVESSSSLIISPAVGSRLSVPGSAPGSALLPSSSVDLSLEANAIARRYLQDPQPGGLGGHAPSPLSDSNMSVATRKYLRKYGLMEVQEEVQEEEEEEEEQQQQEAWVETPTVKLRPQGQRILQQLVGGRRPSSGGAETSVGNILDLSRLRQLPKLF